jgi:hypothetical protein
METVLTNKKQKDELREAAVISFLNTQNREKSARKQSFPHGELRRWKSLQKRE